MDFQTTIPETTPTPDIAPEIAEASFDIVARQDRTEAEVTALRSDVEDVKARVDRISRAAARPALAPSGQESAPEVKGFVDGYLRRGAAHEIKSISGAAPSDGGYAVPRQIDAAIARALTEISPIRAIAQVVQTGSAGYRKLVTTGGTASGWVSETAARPGTATPDFHEIAPPTGELYANPAASQAMLDDVGFDLQAWLASEIAMEFARAEGAAFVNGSGLNQPEGFLTAPATIAADDTRAFGALQYIGSGDAAGLYAESGGALKSLGPSSSLRAIVGSLAEPLRGSPALMMETGAPLVLDLASEDMQLNSATMEAVALGANRLMLGEEVLQFVHAEQIGPRRWALTGLLRGRLGTEHAARDGHAVGARMALLDERILALDPQHTLSVDRIAAIGTAEDEPVYASIRARRSAAAPPSPVHPRVTMAADGTLSLAWTRRIQGGWRWNDGGEGPLIDKDELYEVGVGPVAAPKALWQTSTPSLAISGSERSALATSAPESVVWVRQVGTHARSVPLALTTLS